MTGRIDYLKETDLDVYLFHQGNYAESYHFLGAQVMTYNGMSGVSFTVWAPNAKKIKVIGQFNEWRGDQHPLRRIDDSGVWNIFIEGLEEGCLYKYEIHAQDGRVLHKSDPYAFYSEMRPQTASVVWDMGTYKWKDKRWLNKRQKKEPFTSPMNIYEVHLGSWKLKEDGSFYNYREIAEELIAYCKDTGYSHIELMPLNEHPYDGSWGYQATGYFSLTSRYGEPEDFMHFVDRCHQEGIGVIMDWVPCHFCKDSHGLAEFDGTKLYESGYEFLAENPQWGTLNFDFSKNEVLSFLISNAMFWFDKYHIDGLRVDAVAFMLYLDYGREKNSILNEYGKNENLHAIEFIRKLNKTIFEKYPNVLMIAEESTAWPLVTAPVHEGGLGFNYKWNMGWMNDMLEYMEMDSIYRKFHQNMITFSFTYCFSENYILPLSHDEVVHGKKSLLDKMPGDYWQKFANLRCFYGYMMAHPGKKLLFMGGEIGHFIEWNYKEGLDWHLLDYDLHRKLQAYVKALNTFYLKEKAFYELDQTYDSFEWIDHENHDQSVIAYMRKGVKDRDYVIVVCNFTPYVHEHYKLGVPEPGKYVEVFNSDASEFGGSGVVNEGKIKAGEETWHHRPYSMEVRIPPLATVYFKLKDRPRKKSTKSNNGTTSKSNV